MEDARRHVAQDPWWSNHVKLFVLPSDVLHDALAAILRSGLLEHGRR